MRRIALGTAMAIVALVAAASGASAQTTSSASTARDLTVVNYNILHGFFCPPETDGCRAPDRVALFLSQLEAAKCPQVVGLQEVNGNLSGLIKAQLPNVCGGKYTLAFPPTAGNDKELVFTTLKTTGTKILPLPGGLRGASMVELETKLGPVTVVTTHQDGDKTFPACRDDIDRYKCPKPCPEGATFSECQTILGEHLADKSGAKKAIRIYMGDFNIPAGTPRYERLKANGWIDSHLAAGNPECEPGTGVQCTAGRNDNTLTALQDPNAREQERIDFIFVKPPKGCTPKFDTTADADRDGLGTGLFAAQPAVNGPSGLVWPSDHTAVSMDLTCA